MLGQPVGEEVANAATEEEGGLGLGHGLRGGGGRRRRGGNGHSASGRRCWAGEDRGDTAQRARHATQGRRVASDQEGQGAHDAEKFAKLGMGLRGTGREHDTTAEYAGVAGGEAVPPDARHGRDHSGERAASSGATGDRGGEVLLLQEGGGADGGGKAQGAGAGDGDGGRGRLRRGEEDSGLGGELGGRGRLRGDLGRTRGGARTAGCFGWGRSSSCCRSHSLYPTLRGL
mmetsp:Transcript_51127/g.120016  ORF Transcript_51127/g.120016 Transcript_51127/m.120016 type:complete len:230 (+) Transcript_51127:578-1267(+)